MCRNIRTLHNFEPAASDEEVRAALENAFGYRGDVTITLKDGRRIEGYVFDRRSDGALDQCIVRMFPKDSDERLRIRYSDIAALQFTGKDTAAGKSFDTWLKKWREKKSAGESNIRLDPEKLDSFMAAVRSA